MASRPATLAEDPLDRLARRLAAPMPRRNALRLAGAAAVGLAVPGLRPHRASAQFTGEQTCAPASTNCRAITCPSNTKCCLGPDDPATVSECHTNPHCCDPCDPDGSQCLGNGDCGPGPIADHCFCNEFRRCGKECCSSEQVCCDRLFTSNAPRCCTEQDNDKETCKDGKYTTALLGIAAGVGSVLTGGGLGVAYGVVGAAYGLGNVGFDICADDPPDPDFKALFTPKVARVPRLRSGKGFNAAAARAMQGLAENQARAAGYTIAWIRSIEKSQGAVQAGDTAWAQRHRSAGAGYAREAARCFAREPALRRAAATAVRRSAGRPPKLTTARVRRYQQEVGRRGISPAGTKLLRSAGVDTQHRRDLGREIAAFDARAVARVGVFGDVSDPRFDKASAAMVKALQRSATKLSS